MKFDLMMFGEIPVELEGISAETAQEILGTLEEEVVEEKTEVKETSAVETETAENENKPSEETQTVQTTVEDNNENKPTADVDSETKPQEQNEHTIPYARFKEINEEKKQLQAKLEELTKRLDSGVRQQNTTQEVVEPKADETTTALSKELVEKLDEEATKRAAKALGLSQDELNALDFSDDFVTKRRFETAKQAEINNIMAKARQLEAQDLAHKAEQDTVYRDNMTDLNSIITSEKKEMGEETYAHILKYGEESVLPSMTKAEQKAVINANNRIVKGVPTPEDVITMRYIYQKAKSAYLQAQKPTAQETVQKTKIEEKIKQASALPKSTQVEGANDKLGTGYTQEQLEKFLTVDWDKVPEDAKALLLG